MVYCHGWIRGKKHTNKQKGNKKQRDRQVTHIFKNCHNQLLQWVLIAYLCFVYICFPVDTVDASRCSPWPDGCICPFPLFSLTPPLFRVLVNGLFEMRPDWVMDSEKGQLTSPGVSGMWLNAHQCLRLGHWQLTTLWKYQILQSSLDFYKKTLLLKDLNCQRESPLWHFRKRSQIRLHPSGELFDWVCVLLSRLQHTPLSSQAGERQSGNVKFYFTLIVPSQTVCLAVLSHLSVL